MSPSTVNNIVKSFLESGESSVLKGQAWKPLLSVHGLRALGSIVLETDINKWAQKCFKKRALKLSAFLS